MSTSLGELSLFFSANTADLEASLKDIQKKALATAQSIEKAMGGIGKAGLTLTPKVDHSELYALNKHLDLKEKHFKNVQNYFNRNPLKPRVDDSELKKLGTKRIADVTVRVRYDDPGYSPTSSRSVTTRTGGGSSPTASSTDKPKPIDFNPLISAIESATDSITDALEKGFKSNKKGLIGELFSGVMMGAAFSGGQALYEKGKSAVSGKVEQSQQNKAAYQELSVRTEAVKARVTRKAPVTPKASVTSSAVDNEVEELRQQMLQLNRKEVIEPLAQKVGVKDARNYQGGKKALVNEILRRDNPANIKRNLPYLDTLRQESAQASQQASKQTAEQLKAQLKQTIQGLNANFKAIKGSGDQSALSDLGNEIEKQYQSVISLLSENVSADMQGVLASAKLQIAKVRKATSRESQKVVQQQAQTTATPNQQQQRQLLRRASRSGDSPQYSPIYTIQENLNNTKQQALATLQSTRQQLNRLAPTQLVAEVDKRAGSLNKEVAPLLQSIDISVSGEESLQGLGESLHEIKVLALDLFPLDIAAPSLPGLIKDVRTLSNELDGVVKKINDPVAMKKTSMEDVLLDAYGKLPTFQKINSEGLKRRNTRKAQQAAEQIKSSYTSDQSAAYSAEATGQVFVIGGLAGMGGKHSQEIAPKVALAINDPSKQVTAVENPYSDKGKPDMQLIANVVGNKVNQDSFKLAEAAFAAYKANPQQKIDLVGYSGGGYNAQGAGEILKHLGVPFQAYGIGTPNIGATRTLGKEYQAIGLANDAVITGGLKKGETAGFKGEQDKLFPGKTHALEEFLGRKESYEHLVGSIQGKEVTQPKNRAGLGTYRATDISSYAEQVFSVLEDVLSVETPKLAEQMSVDITERMGSLKKITQKLPEDLKGEAQEYIEALEQAQELLRNHIELNKGKKEKTQPQKPKAFIAATPDIPQVIRELEQKPVQSPLQGIKGAVANGAASLRGLMNPQSAYKGLTADAAKQLQGNYQQIFKEVASASNADIDLRRLPELKVDEKLLQEQSADALYDIERNQIIISKELQVALVKTPAALSNYADQMAGLVHEARHALQFDFGNLSVQDLQMGIKPNVKMTPFKATGKQAQQAAIESLQYARATTAKPLDKKEQSVLLGVEADASDFEKHTKDILDNVAATATYENAFNNEGFKKEQELFKQAIDELEKLFGEGLNRLTAAITKLGQSTLKSIQETVSGFLTGNKTTRSAGKSGFTYVRRGRPINQVPDAGIPDPWEDVQSVNADVVGGTTSQTPRNDNRSIGQRVKVRVRKPIENSIKQAEKAAQEAVESFNNRLANYVDGNFREVLTEVANLSGVDFDAVNAPQLKVNEAAIAKAGQEVFYDAQKNQVIISRRIRDILQSNPEALEQYAKKLTPLVAAARKAVDVQAPDEQAADFSRRTGEVFARIAARSKGKRSNFAPVFKEMSASIDQTVDALALGAKESEKLKKRAYLYLRALQRAARTPDNMQTGVKSIGKGKGDDLQSTRNAFNRMSQSTAGTSAPGQATWERIYNQVVPQQAQQRMAQQKQQAVDAYMANPNTPKSAVAAADLFQEKFQIPIELYAKLNIKGIGDVVQDLQKYVGRGLDKLQEKAATLPYFGDMAVKAVGGLKMLNVAGVGAGITFLRFLGVVAKFTALAALAAQVAVVTQQFDALRTTFILTANQGNRSAEAFDRVMQSASNLRVDKATVGAGATEIFGNTAPKMGGQFAEKITQTATETAAIYGNNPQQSQQIFSAFGQLTQDSTLNMQDFQQIMNTVPGSLDIMARSMGMTNAEFQNFIKTNSVLVEDFMPRFIQQLNIENQPKLSAAMDSLSAATNRYNNAVTDMQLSVGKVLAPMEKLRLNATAQILETVGKKGAEIFATWGTSMAFLSLMKLGIAAKNVLVSVLPLVAKLPLVGTALLAIRVAIVNILPILTKMMREFLIFQLAIDAVTVAWKTFNSAGGDFKNWADDSVKGVENLGLAFDKARQKAGDFRKALPTDETQLKATGSRFEDTLIGSIFGKENTRWAEGKMDGFLQKIDPTWKSYAQKELYDKEESVAKLRESGGAVSDKVLQLRTGQDPMLRDFVEIEKKLESIRMKRRALASTAPDDLTGLRELREQERQLLSERDIIGDPISRVQSEVAAKIKRYEDALAKIDEEAAKGAWTQESYDRATSGLKVSLKEAEGEQRYLNSQIKDATTSLMALQRQFKALNAEFTDTNAKITQTNSTVLAAISKSASLGGLTQGQANFARLTQEQTVLGQKLETNKQLALEMKESLAASGGEEILANWKVDFDSTGAEQFGLLAERAQQQGSAKEEEVFNQYKRLKEMGFDTTELEAQLAQKEEDARRQLEELSKSVTDYYRGIDRSTQELALTAQQQAKAIATTEAKTKLKSAVIGLQDNFVSQFIDSIIGILESLDQPFEEGIKAQQEALKNKFQYQDTYRQGTELRKQLPGADNGLTQQDINQDLLPALRIETPNNGEAFRQIAEGANQANLAITQLNTGLASNQTQLDQTSEKVTNTGTSLDNLQAKVTASASIPQTETLVEKAVGSDAQILAKQVTFDTIFAQIKAQWQDTTDVDNYWEGVSMRLGNLGMAVQVLGAGIGDMWNQSMASAGAFFDDTAARLGQAISGSDLWNKAVQGVCDTLKLPPELAQGFASVLGTKVNPAMQDVNKSIEASHPRLKQSSGLTQGIQKEARKLSGMFAYNIPVLSKIGSFMNGLINKVKEWGAWVGQVIQQFVQGIPTIGQVGDAIGNLAQGFGNSVGNMAQGLGDTVGNLAQSAGGVVNNIKGALGFGGSRSTPTQQGVGKVGGYTIHESVGSRNLPVNSFRDIHKHHPSAGIEDGRNYKTIDGEFEEIRKTRDNRTLIKKDFILSKNGRADVAVPSFAAGYAKVLNDDTNTVQIYADKAMTKLLGQSLHMKNIAVKSGQEVQYGQTLGIQSNFYRGRRVGVHAHIEAELEQFKKYIQDLKDGVFEGIKGQEQAHYPGDGHNHYGEENAKKANQGMDSSGSGYRDTVVMRRTGQMDNYGLEKLLVTIYDEAGKVVKTFFANSGKPDKQNLFGGANTTPAGSNAPVEYGKYTIGAPVAGNSAAVGKTFIPTNPTFQTKRNSIGFHVDADRGVGGAGSAGCIVFATQAEFDSFRKAIATNGVNTLVFEGQTGGSQKPKVITGRQALSQAAPRTLMDSVDIFGAQVGAQASKGITAKPQRSSGGIYWGQAVKYAPSDLSGLTDRGRKAMEALKDPKVRAFLDAVAVAELGDTAAAKGGYGYLYGDVNGKESFNPNNLKTHPEKFVSKWGYNSNATGRYQVVQHRDAKVWDEEKGRLGLRDFKPQSQELLAVSRLMYREILDDIQRGDIKGALNKPGNFDASSEWASIQGNPYGQGTSGGKTSTFLTNYKKSLNQARANGVASSAPVQGSGGSTRVSAADVQGFGSLVGQAAAKPLPKLKPMANIPSSPMPSADLPDFNEFMRQNGFTDETAIRPSVPVSQPKPVAKPTVKPAPKPVTQPAKTAPTAAAVTQPAKPAAPVAPPKSYLTLPPVQVKPQPALELTKQAAVVISDAQKQALANSQRATNLANQQATANSAWATLQAKIQETQAQTQKKRGLEDLEGRIASAQDQLTRDMAGLDRNEPRRQAKEAELGVLSEYRDKNRDLLRQRDEVASAVATTERSIKLFNEAIADPKSGLTDAQRELLKRQVPGLQQDLPRLKELLGKIDKVVGQQEKVRDAKLGYARETARLNEQDRTFKVAGEITEADAQKLEMRIAGIKDFQRDNPGDLSLGDPIELQGQLDLMRQALKIKQEIKALEDRERTGDLKPEEKAKLEKLKKDLNSLSTDAINRRVARETEDRSALLRNRKVEDSRASFESRRAVTEAKIKEIERTQERAPWDTSKGDAVELRRGLAIEDENLKSQENKNQLEEKRRSKRLDQEGFNRAMAEEERRHAAVIANINAEAEAEKSKRKRTEADRTFRVAAEITEADAQNLERRIAAIKDYQRDNPGDLKLGDPIELQGQLDLMRQALKIKQEIRDLENRQRNGELKPQEKARLETLKKQQNSLDVSAINRRVIREKDDRNALLQGRAVNDEQNTYERSKSVKEAQLRAVEQYQELRPWDMSMGDPIEMRQGMVIDDEKYRLKKVEYDLGEQLRNKSISKEKYNTDLAYERQRHDKTIANINAEAEANKKKRAQTEQDRTFKVAAEIEELDASKLEAQITAIQEYQRENPGDLKMGDPIELKGQLDVMREALRLKKDIQDLETRGNLKPEEKAKLLASRKQLSELDVSAINSRVAREREARDRLLKTRGIDDKRSSFEIDRAVSENQLKEIELAQQSDPFDLSKGDPITIKRDLAIQDENLKFEAKKNQLDEDLASKRIGEEKYKADMAAEEKRHETTLANINAEADAEKTKRDSAKADFDLENKQREFENRKKAVEAEVEALSIDGRDFEAKQLQNSLAKEEQALGLEASIRALEKLAETNPKVREELEQTKAELEELNQIKLDNLEEQWAKVTEERDRAIEERMVDSQSNLLEAQASALSNKGMGWDARELQKQAAVMKQELGFKQQTRNLEEFIKAQGIAGQRAEALRMQLQQLGQVQMANVQDQFSPWNDVLGSMTGGFKTFFSDVLTGSKSLKDAFTGLVDSILGSLANLAAEWLTNQIFGEIFGLGKSGKSGGDFMAGKLNGGGQPQNNIVPFSPQSATGFLPGVSLGTTPMQPMYVQDVSQDFGGIADGNLLGGGQGGGNFLDSLMGGNIFGGGSVFDVGSPMPVNMVQANNDIFGSLINGFTGILGGGGGIGNLIGGVTGALGGGGGGLGSLIAPLFSFFGMNDGGIAGIDGVKTTFANYAAGGTVAESLKSAMDKERNMNGGRPVVPAVLTAGERVLTVEQNKRFEALGGTPILNFAQGGRVGQGSFAKSVGEKSGSSNSVSVNVPVNIQGGNDGSIDERKFKQILDAKVRQVITEESRQGGSLRRR